MVFVHSRAHRIRPLGAALFAVALVASLLSLPATTAAQQTSGSSAGGESRDLPKASPRRAVPAYTAPGSNLIRIAAGAFDPLVDQAPSLIQPISVDDLGNAPVYWLVQVKQADAVADAVAAIRSSGATIAGVVPERTYFVRATLQQRTAFDASGAIRWSGLYQPGWKFAPRTPQTPGLLDLEGPQTYRVWIFEVEPNPAALRDQVEGLSGVRVLPGGTDRVFTVEASAAQVPAIAGVQGVEWIGVPSQAVPLNMNARWVTDTGIRDVYAATKRGRLTGAGQTAGVADTAINYLPDPNRKVQAYFKDCPAGLASCKAADYTQSTAGSSADDLANVDDNNTNHRKMAAYFDIGESGHVPPDAGSHGTHVSGSVTGDFGANGTWQRADGMAPAARLVHQNISSPSGGLSLPADSYELLAQAYRPRNPSSVSGYEPNGAPSKYRANEDARTHNNSYGLIVPVIDTGDANRFDQFIWEHEDMIPSVSAGNSGPAPGTIGSPSVSKNILSSAASANGRQPMVSIDSLASFSSHGPTADTRIGPTVATPGQIVISAKGGGADEEHTLQGTSMSSPVLTGIATLMRQYFWDGYGPAGGKGFGAGRPNLARRHNPSAALIKAAFVNGAVRMKGYYTGDDGSDRAQDGKWPSFGQGFGLANLDNSLFFRGDDLNNWYHDVWRADDEAFAFPTGAGETRSYKLQVEAGKPFDVSMVYTDAPNALPAGTPAIVNQLDLTVTGPDGTVYFGNNFNSETDPKVEKETTLPGPPDADPMNAGINNVNNLEERIRIAEPQAGEYTVTVTADALLDGPQGFALAASGALTDGPARGEGLLPDEQGSPTVSKIKVTPVQSDVAWATWRTSEPTTGKVIVAGGGATQEFVDSYNVDREDGFEGIDEGQVETSEEYGNKPVLGTRHEALITNLSPGFKYSVSIQATDRATNQVTTDPQPFTSTRGIFGVEPRDVGQLFEDDPRWGKEPGATQLYVGKLDAETGALGAFMFRMPEMIDPGNITGAAVRLTSWHDITQTYKDDARYVVDLLNEGVEPEWGTQTYQEIRDAEALARLNPMMADRRGGGVPYTYSFDCQQLAALKSTLANVSDDGQRKAAFRALGLSDYDESLFSYDIGFNRRSRGPQNRPEIMLYFGSGQTDPLPCNPNAAAPTISNITVAPTNPAEKTGAVVTWRTDVDSDSVVLFRQKGSSKWIEVGSPVRTTHHMVEIKNLDDSKRYEFAVRSAACNGETTTDTNGGRGYEFFAPEPKPGPFEQSAPTYTYEQGDEGWTTRSESANPVEPPWRRQSPGHNSQFSFRKEPYTDDASELLISPTIEHPGGLAAVKFFTAYDTEPGFDYLHVDFKPQGEDWVTAESFDGTNQSYPEFDQREAMVELPAGPMKVRFRFQSDELISSPLYQGVAVDDVTVGSRSLPTGPELQPRLTEGAPPLSSDATGMNPPATREVPSAADRLAGTALCATAEETPLKRPGVRRRTSDRTPYRGERIHISTYLRACADPGEAAKLGGTDVILQRRRNGRFENAQRMTLTNDCRALFRKRIYTKEAVFRVLWPKQHPEYREGRSKILRIVTHPR